jgi:predicted hotdog family 3-hydroxylacyl-ACP dehydratase
VTNVYDFRERGPAAAQRAFHQWSARHAGADRDAFEAGFVRGARWATSTTSSLSPAVAQLVEFVQWLRDQDEHERAYDWALSNATAEEHAIRAADGELEELPF